jgi:hypothetical protein
MGFLDKSGNVVVPFIYNLLFDFNGELAFVSAYDENDWENTWNKGCYINRDGVEVTPYEYDGSQWGSWIYESAHEGLTIARKDDKFGCIDSNGNVAIPFVYGLIRYYSGGLFYVYKHYLDYTEYKSGYVNKNGEFPLGDYDRLISNDIYDGLIFISIDRTCGFIDAAGKIAVPFIYENASSFGGGLAWAQQYGKWGILEIETNYGE